MTGKHEWRKEGKALYLPKTQPELITIPAQKFFLVSGTGNPNTSPAFAENIGILYALSYAVRMMPKQGYTPEGLEPYTVYPLEGVWGLVDPAAGIERQEQLFLHADDAPARVCDRRDCRTGG